MLVAGDFVFVAGLPSFDPVSWEVTRRPFEQQAELALGQMKRCLEAVGSLLEQVVKRNIYCTDPAYYGTFNEAYVRYFPKRSIGTHLPVRAVLLRAVRCRSGLHRGRLIFGGMEKCRRSR